MKKALEQKHAVVGLSGGVDSAVSAALLLKQGYSVTGVYMKNWSEDFGDFGCTWASDSEDARKVAQTLGVPFYIWDFEKEYRKKVVSYFLREYKKGRTPNPDVICNSEIKFKLFLDRALKLGADFVATGHYARIEKKKKRVGEEYRLLKGIDPSKDQSYFLYTLKQRQLSRTLFPLGEYKKSEVRKMARKFKLPNADKKDSQGICFIGKINVSDFLKAHIKAKKGDILTVSGSVLGRHEGLPFYTIGQRGMGLGGDGPYYVAYKNFKLNALIVTNKKDDPRLWRKKFTLSDLSWTGNEPKMPFKARVAIRYHHPEQPALIQKMNDAKLSVTFQVPQRAITEGQSAVIYKNDVLLGGGVIEHVT
jgi:tRNA-uridine 2-sulfurtransferase